MKITELSELNTFKKLLKEDTNGRKIDIFKISEVIPFETFYPNCLFKGMVNNQYTFIKPIDERVMSLNIDTDSEMDDIYVDIKNSYHDPLFYFIYNTDNYYHFIYDSLPYLISYLELKKEISNLKILMNYPNYSKKEFYRFVSEFLQILNITSDDIIIVDKNTKYDEIYISDSFTHGKDSNLPPRSEIYDLYRKMVSIVKELKLVGEELPKKIYISRRTWLNNDTSNIGTNYTTRRKMECEDELVDILVSNGYTEIFTETLSTIDKILLFDQASDVIGSIGGGLCNILFSKKGCRLISICSPTFLDVNNRFKFCFTNVETLYYENSFHIENDYWKKWMRVKCENIVGEIEEVLDDSLIVSYTDNIVAGWNSEMEYKKVKLKKNECVALDHGLNSNWSLDINKFRNNKWIKF